MLKKTNDFILEWTIACYLLLPGLIFYTDGQYVVQLPLVYVAFSGDLIINYTIPSNVSIPNAFIRLTAVLASKNQEITTRGIQFGQSVGQVRIPCGTIEYAVPVIAELHTYAGGPILASSRMTVEWPKFTLSLPDSHIAQTQQVMLTLTSMAACNSFFRRYSFQLDLEYSTDDSPNNTIATFSEPQIIHSHPISDITKSISELSYECDLFDTKGNYRAVLRNSFDSSKPVSVSNIMITKWSLAYKLSVNDRSVFPCTGHVTVLYTKPECAGKNNKIRIFKLARDVSGSLAAPLKRKYISETKAEPDNKYVLFNCDIFSEQAAGFCFVYVTTSRRGSVSEQDSYCLSAHPDSVIPIDGGWSNWSKWGRCSVTCGTGKQSRFRYCNNPHPEHGGRFCEGNPVEWRPCFLPCPDMLPKTPLHSAEVNGSCACGCHLGETEGEIIATGRCEGLSIWLIKVEENHQIRLSFRYFDLYKDQQWVKIRSGETSSADLVALSHGEITLTEVVSTTNSMLIEFMTRSNTSLVMPYRIHDAATAQPLQLPPYPYRDIHVHGFIAVYSAQVKNKTISLQAVSVPIKPGKGSIWDSKVTIVGISLCSVIVLVAVAFAIYHRVFYTRDHKYTITSQEETPTHMVKSTSMHSTPSHHSALSQGIEIDYDMERPLTGGTPRKKYRKDSAALVSRGSSISSNRSNTSKKNLKIKTKADVEPGGSPKPSNRYYSPFPSPHVNNETVTEIKEESNSLFNTSPLLNRKPRSPKIHPSPRFKRPSPLSPASPIKTKHELLTKKRKDRSAKRKEDRIVMGAAETPVYEEIKQIASTPGSTGSATPVGKIDFIDEGTLKRKKGDKYGESDHDHSSCADTLVSDHKPSQITEGAIQLHTVKTVDGETRKPGSGTSDDSCSPDKSEGGKQQTTSFIEESKKDKEPKPRRPTSLIETYQKPIKSISLPSINKDATATLDGGKTVFHIPKLERHKALPKPDGQSPKSPRQQNSKSSTPKSVRSSSVHSSRSKLTLSPARSIHTPSEVASEGLEMEYDDYIEYDDTFSYFDPLETEKLQWKGVEKIGTTKAKENGQKDEK
ncbi:hypothetical protein FSP39_009050 [Pinctada imbricata]|uniref:CUB domain-containing protein n=1 Tax=Pinctada imbricata TaxID=66713 RepID=A0AA88Y7Z5_PINIB|nr:hypothetical protein FSP39_009050 [Pinctada imbricata]